LTRNGKVFPLKDLGEVKTAGPGALQQRAEGESLGQGKVSQRNKEKIFQFGVEIGGGELDAGGEGEVGFHIFVKKRWGGQGGISQRGRKVERPQEK